MSSRTPCGLAAPYCCASVGSRFEMQLITKLIGRGWCVAGAVCNNKWIYNVYNSTHIGVIFYDIVLVVIFGLDFKNYAVTLLIKTLLPPSQSQS